MSAAQRSHLMSRIPSKDTQAELTLRRRLHALGYRFRLHGALTVKQVAALRDEHKEIRLRGGKLPGSPDLVFSAKHKVIFMNGCFWHGHNCPVGQHRPSTNTEYWNSKLDDNIARDQRNRHDLDSLGWNSLTLWECELKTLDEMIARTAEFLGPPAVPRTTYERWAARRVHDII